MEGDSQTFSASTAPWLVYGNCGKDRTTARRPLSTSLDSDYLSKSVQPFLWKLPKEVTSLPSSPRSPSFRGSADRSSAVIVWVKTANLTSVWEYAAGPGPRESALRSPGSQSKTPTTYAFTAGQSKDRSRRDPGRVVMGIEKSSVWELGREITEGKKKNNK